MKIDTDLRLAIKAAEKAQPQDGYDARNKREQDAVIKFFAAYPEKAKRARLLSKQAAAAYARYQAADEAICKEFGLRRMGGSQSGFQLGGCGASPNRFVKAGGKLPTRQVRWSADNVMAQIAAATPKEGAKIIKSLGINWE